MASWPEPGVYRNIPEGDYHALDAASASRLHKILQRTPSHLAAYLQEWTGRAKEEESRAIRIGNSAHALILQPENIEELCVLAPDINRRTNAGKEQWASFLIEAGSRTILKEDELHEVMKMRDAVLAHRTAAGLLRDLPERELTVVWHEAGLLCKARIDACSSVSANGNIILDIKTTRDASPRGFARESAKYGYGLKAAWYTVAMHRAQEMLLPLTVERLPDTSFYFVAVENSRPYNVVVYEPTRDDLSLGWRYATQGLDIWRSLLTKPREEWPGFARDDEVLSLSQAWWYDSDWYAEEGD